MLIIILLLIGLLWAWRTVLWRPRAAHGVDRQVPLLIGHRGVRPVPADGSTAAGAGVGGELPLENSVAAFRMALEAGLDGVECDVQLTADGQMVLVHDRTLRGLTVTASTLEELRSREPRLSTLPELLELMSEFPGTLLNIELKLFERRGRGLEPKVVAAVKRYGLADRVIISSFDPLALARMRFAAPGFRTGLLTSPTTPALLSSGTLAGWLHVDALHPDYRQVDEAMIRRAAERGLALNVWTVNDGATAQRLIEAGVSGIIGDDPAVLKRAAGRP